MYFMMDHNESKYIKFLRCMNKYKCDWVCYCCCKFMIIEQLKQLDNDLALKVGGKSNEAPSGKSEMETSNVSIEDYKIKTTGNDISIDTTMLEL